MDRIEMIGGAAVFLFYLANEIRKYFTERRRRKRKSSVDENHELDAEIYDLITNMLIRHGCHRVYITQFSNGERYFSGQSKLYMTITHERVRDDLKVRKIKRYVQGQLIGKSMHDILTDIKNTGEFSAEDIDKIEDEDLQTEMHTFEVKRLYYVRITNQDGNTSGVLNMHWNHKYQLNEIEMQEVRNAVRLIENAFNKYAP